MTKVDYIEKGEPISEQEIRIFESEIGTQLPNQYRDFLLEYNGGSLAGEVSYKSEFELLGFLELSADTDLGLRRAWVDFQELMPEGLLPIAVDIGNEPIMISLRADSSGVIYLGSGTSGGLQEELVVKEIEPNFECFLNELVSFEKSYDSIEITAQNGGVSELDVLNESGWSIDDKSVNGLTLIQEAIKYGNVKLMDELISRKAHLEGTLHIAAINKRYDLIQKLYEGGADLHEEDESGSKPYEDIYDDDEDSEKTRAVFEKLLKL